jgi:hypothetical protein
MILVALWKCVAIYLIFTMPTLTQQADENTSDSDENMEQLEELRKKQLSASLALGRRRKKK